jgi:hypothetical protein
MKELKLTQMENIYAGADTWACISQVAGGMSVLITLAAIGSFALGPVGWLAFGLGATSLVAGAIADPTACDT